MSIFCSRGINTECVSHAEEGWGVEHLLVFKVEGLGVRVWGLGVRVWGLGFGVWSLRFEV